MILRSILGAVIFYTSLPLPTTWVVEWQRIARWAPLIGLLIGGTLSLTEKILQLVGVPDLTCGALLVCLWLVITGGLHLDGVIDTADGLSVPEQERRLEVMSDSVAGAFGVMAAVVVLLVKTAALSELANHSWLVLMVSASWGRWAQILAIALYPYLKPNGKGAFHKQAMQIPQDLLWGLLPLLLVSCCWLVMTPQQWLLVLLALLGSSIIAWLVSAWFHWQLGGHTGDTYGATVEWTEALILCWLTTLSYW